ncbi:MAG: hypothetical protein A2172_05135 [Candidatus Woykebacteria bacterium RBG_13_40_15]|uniref:Type II secretion system protein GspG C-terminal domain-containing protein n=1 Tax=Candidatus Woykebacteria bacterium RBG_13_40_15 TaxID=1802593 RepID=A0A1G1W892_9BACT|nr:MAG: hypothetical protein A2172_05135 [Candidatus Woykebacteria bacterium RBG_13_40_15]
MRVFGIIGLLIAVLAIAFLVVKELDLYGKNGGNVKTPINNAASVQSTANLSALATKLNIYYAENGYYPTALSDIDSYGLDLNAFEYQLCSSNKAFIKSGSASSILIDGSVSSKDSGGC